ncbi:CIS tube protein [Microcoleus sp. BROC3]|uniref:CIS tube protein n=1 Tax=Microcoleus sp. BROC3 TaxID=3055323 RepID=UPI002FCEA4ED
MASSTSSPITSTSSKSGNLVKALLISDDGVPQIEFMFNPTELVFEGVVETSESPGARTEDKGTPKVSFSHVKAYKVTINKILFDTYEEGGDVVKQYIENFRKSVEFVKGKERPPIYQFMWGKQVYLRRCFIEKLNYKLTMFLPDGTPVRAVIDSLTLKEADEPNENGPLGAKPPAKVDRQADSLDNRKSSGKTNRRTSNI